MPERIPDRYFFPALFCLTFLALLVVTYIYGIPPMWIHDEFSYMLAADTFLHGRITNPPHELPQFFENPHLIISPTYMSKYPPGQPFILAIGILLGHPFFGVLIALSLFISCFTWMLSSLIDKKFIIPIYILMLISLGLSKHWGRSYIIGALPAAAACLMIGTYLYSLKYKIVRGELIFIISCAILSVTRPYEGLILSVMIFLMFIYDICRNNLHLESTAKSLTILSAGGLIILAFHAYYNWHITGNTLLIPNRLHIDQYMYAPYLWFQNLLTPEMTPSVKLNHLFHYIWEKNAYDKIAAMSLIERTEFLASRINSSPSLIFMLILAPLALVGRQFDRFALRLLLIVLVSFLLSSLLVWMLLYYIFVTVVAATALNFYLAYRIIKHRIFTKNWSIITTTAIVPCLIVTGLVSLNLPLDSFNSISSERKLLSGVHAPILHKDELVHNIEAKSPANLVFVRYRDYEKYNERDELLNRMALYYNTTVSFVYNSADIDSQRTVFAHDLGAEENRKLIDYYNKKGQNRKLWLLDLSYYNHVTLTQPETALNIRPLH